MLSAYKNWGINETHTRTHTARQKKVSMCKCARKQWAYAERTRVCVCRKMRLESQCVSSIKRDTKWINNTKTQTNHQTKQPILLFHFNCMCELFFLLYDCLRVSVWDEHLQFIAIEQRYRCCKYLLSYFCLWLYLPNGDNNFAIVIIKFFLYWNQFDFVKIHRIIWPLAKSEK